MNNIIFIFDTINADYRFYTSDPVIEIYKKLRELSVDVGFVCEPSKYAAIDQTLSQHQLEDCSIFVDRGTKDFTQKISNALQRKRYQYLYLFDVRVLADDEFVLDMDEIAISKLKGNPDDTLYMYESPNKIDGYMYGGHRNCIEQQTKPKQYITKVKAKQNVKSLIKKIKTQK